MDLTLIYYMDIEERLTNLIYLSVLEEVMIPSVREVSPANDFVFQQNNCFVLFIPLVW
jgi:hypothetical protein